MIKFNDKNAQINDEDIYINVSPVNEKEDIHIECSYLFTSGIITESKIVSQYDLFVIGNISAKSINVKGNLVCFGSVEAERIVINGETYIKEELNAENVQFGQDACLGSVTVNVIKSENMIFAKGVVNVDDEISTNDSIISMEGIQGIGDIIGSITIAKEYIDVSNNCSHDSIIIDEIDNSESKKLNPDTPENGFPVCFKDITSLEDYDSFEYKTLDEFNILKESFKNELKLKYKEEGHLFKELIKDISSVAEFDQGYNNYFITLTRMNKLAKRLEFDENLKILDLKNFYEYYDKLPSWISEMSVIKEAKINILSKVESIYLNINYDIDDFVNWSICLNCLVKHKNDISVKIYEEILEKMTLMIGVKSKLISNYYEL